MPSTQKLEIIHPETGREPWRDLAEKIGGGRWFDVRHDGGVCTVRIFGLINLGPHWHELVELIGDASDIRLLITDCLGGAANLALAFVQAYSDRISESRICGRAFSAGYVFALAGQKIIMEKGAKLLLHEPALFTFGGFEAHVTNARSLQATRDQIMQLLAERTELPQEIVKSWLNGADIYFTAEQAKAFGLVDEIFTHEPVPKTGLPQQAAKANEQPDPAPQPTERERLFRSFLNAFFHDGNLNVSNRETFLRDVFSSIAIRTNQINNI